MYFPVAFVDENAFKVAVVVPILVMLILEEAT